MSYDEGKTGGGLHASDLDPLSLARAACQDEGKSGAFSSQSTSQSASTSSASASSASSSSSASSASAASAASAAAAPPDLGPCFVGRIAVSRQRSENDALLQRAVSCVYTTIIKPAEEGGIKDWMHEHCLAFTDAAEHRMEYTALFEDYEEKMEAALQAFARQEGLSTREVYERFSDGKGESIGTDNNVQLLLAATNYAKFVKLMRRGLTPVTSSE